MRKVFRRYACWMALGLVVACGQISRLEAADPDTSSGPALMSPTVEAALVNQAPARTARSTAAASTKRGRTDDWASATASDRGAGSNRHLSRPLPPASNSRFATADGPVEPAVSQAVANSWRRSSRASVRSATESNGASSEAASSGEPTNSVTQSAIGAKFSTQPNFVSPGVRVSATVASQPTPIAETIFEDEAPLPGGAPLLVAARVSTTDTPAPDSDVSPATSAPTSAAGGVANTSTAAAVAQPNASVQTVATAATTPLHTTAAAPTTTTPASTSTAAAHQPAVAGATPLAERRPPLGYRVARLRSAIQAGRADVQHASAQPGSAVGGAPSAANGVKQTAGFEGTVIRDVPLAEAETIPAPGADATSESADLAESTTGECSDCGDDCCEECCEECPRRRPLLALIDKLDECKAKCRSCCACNQESWNNCNCNGSYKFPVPPLYTYHWPGLYSAELMTDYHSPWRFPPLKPYTDELPSAGEGPPQPLTMVVPTNHQQASSQPTAKPTKAPAKKPSTVPARAHQAAAAKPAKAKPAAARPPSAQRIATQATPRATAATAVQSAASAVPAPAERIIGEPEPMSKKICRAYGIKE